jgi:radical S-adenosyl methionine domain-containing protein 2
MKIKTINFHLWDSCNMRCKFCYATFTDIKSYKNEKSSLTLLEQKNIIKQMTLLGTEKVNFVGGEPTLCNWLPELVKYAKSLGLVTSIVSNGWKFKDINYLNQYEGTLDWLGISIDSFHEESLIKIGRANVGKTPIKLDEYKSIFNNCDGIGIKTKINTVVMSENYCEVLSPIINELKPKRWKVLKVMQVEGQNNKDFANCKISNSQFKEFIEANKLKLSEGIVLIMEEDDLIRGSYIMIDPKGRFFDSTSGKHHYSEPILSVGILKAVGQISFSEEKFIERGGNYAF